MPKVEVFHLTGFSIIPMNASITDKALTLLDQIYVLIGEVILITGNILLSVTTYDFLVADKNDRHLNRPPLYLRIR